MVDIEIAIKSLKNGKSPGPGMITNELVKAGPQSLMVRIMNLFNTCIINKRTPQEWKISHIVSIYKKGDRKDVQNYRGLSINSVFSRLYIKVINNKSERKVKDLIGEDQSGFRAGRSCVDNLFVLQQLIQKRTSVGEETQLALIDLEKAYDSVPRCKLWEILTEISIDPELVEVIMEIYDNNIAHARHGNTLSQPIVPTKGLRQGCSLSPVPASIESLETKLSRYGYTSK
jgi:hypothetical protein